MSDNSNKTRRLIMAHCSAYPKLEIQDIFKFLFQSSFGCEHLLSSEDAATDYISREYKSTAQAKRETEPLDGDYFRVPLSYMDKGLSAKTLGKLLVLSARREENGLSELKNKLKTLVELTKDGLLPFSVSELESAISEWESGGYSALHHSSTFREEYSPSYRVISNRFVPFLPVFTELDKLRGNAVVAIDGGSASGKSTLAGVLEKIYPCTVIHADDFFLPPEKRTPERLSEVGGNIDYERILSEVLVPLSRGDKIGYRKFDCQTATFSEKTEIAPEGLVIVEGAYSMHPELEKYYDLSVFLDISSETQTGRINRRNSPKMAERFFGEWIPLEKIYFEKTDIKARCDMTVKIK